MEASIGETYNLSLKPSIVCALHDGVVEVVGIALVLILKFVEEIKKLEREGRRGAEHRCRKPHRPEQLSMMRTCVGVAVAVAHDEAVNTIQVEDHVVVERRRVGTTFTGWMTELNNFAE